MILRTPMTTCAALNALARAKLRERGELGEDVSS